MASDANVSEKVDPVVVELVRNRCETIAEEMNADLVRTGYSPNIKERRDCSTALFDADAEMVSQAETMPVHLGAMPFSVAAAVQEYEGVLSPGDAVLLNDPFRGGAHLPDMTLVTPVFADGTLLGYAANRAHHADVGGNTAGSVAADTTDIYQEGIRVPPVKLVEGGERNDELVRTLLANVRTPTERRGDLRAQEAANETARGRLRELAADHDPERLATVFDAVKDYSERRMRAAIAEIPDGEASFEDRPDSDGRGGRDIRIAATVTVDGEAVTVDFEGTASQTEGPVNAVFAVTASATYYAVRCVTDPDIPPNHGCYRPVTVEAPSGSVVNPDPPAPVVGGNLETSQRVTDVVLGALSRLVPDRTIAGGQGTMNNLTLGGTDPRDGSPYAFYETQGGGMGGRPGRDGLDAVHVHMSNTRNTPAEVLETAYPLRVQRYSLRPDSGGAGEHRGGLGLRRDIEVRDHEAEFSVLADRHESRPYGLAGGESGATGRVTVRPPGGKTETLPPKTVRTLSPGTVVSVRTPGGGGYGDPTERSVECVRRDLRLGKITAEFAREHYGEQFERLDEESE